MTKREGTKKQTPVVYVTRGEVCGCGDTTCSNGAGSVYIPVQRDGEHTLNTADICYKDFCRITGIKLKPGEVAEARITGKKIRSVK